MNPECSSPSVIYDRQPNKPMCFPANYAGPLLILLSSKNHLGKIHSVSAGKFLTKNFVGVLTIHSTGSQQIKVTFDSIKNANIYATSPLLDSN